MYETIISSTNNDSDNGNVLTTFTETTSDCVSYCREVCQWSMEIKLHKDQPVGAPGFIVEIVESKFGKTEYNCKRFVRGQ